MTANGKKKRAGAENVFHIVFLTEIKVKKIYIIYIYTVFQAKTPQNEILCVCFIFQNIVHS